MATFYADQVRAVAIELQNKARNLYQAILPIYETTRQWTLNGTDPMLPMPFEVRVQLASYNAVYMETLKLKEWVTLLLTAQLGDTLTYPPPPISMSSGLADGSALADGSTLADGNG
jgi:hypothetical protein